MRHTNASSSTKAVCSDQRLRGSLAIHLVKQILPTMDVGRLIIELPSGELIDHRASIPGPEATLTIRRWRTIRRLLVGGNIGFAQSYIDRDWSSSDLTALIELAARNGERFLGGFEGILPVRVFNFVKRACRLNSKRGSRRNIRFHYDLGNEFYNLWLGPSMFYSSAIFPTSHSSLEEAQRRKMARIVDLLQLRREERVLEIGCGWGRFATELALRTKAYVTGITLSASQLEYGQNLVRCCGAEHLVDLRLEDYRETHGQFDRIVSIEMLEAVGRSYWKKYFGTLHDRLRPGGVAVIQVITIAEERAERYHASTDFIQRYIFPGGCLPSLQAIKENVAKAGLELISMETFGNSYALTLSEWRHRFLLAWPRIEALGFGNRFRRLWEYYLSYCEAGFRAGAIDVGLYVLRHSNSRPRHGSSSLVEG
jgi:cyclopropane-fatty-acyl-phospholipid synthase